MTVVESNENCGICIGKWYDENVRTRKLLLIAPVFFGYYKEMIKEAKTLGYDVTYICDSPSNSNLLKAVGRVNKNLIQISVNKYFSEKVIPTVENNSFDKVLIVGGMTFSFAPNMIARLKELMPAAEFIMYQWDSEHNLPYSTGIHPYIDRLYSFDRHDCESDSKYNFLPLFYIRQYEETGREKNEKFEYDFSYVGTAHPQKYKYINEISSVLKETYSRQYIYHYMPSVIKYAYHKVVDKEFAGAKYREFKTEKLSSAEMAEVFRKSKCILDAPQKGQTGLTIRTLECLGAKKKLITSNADIVNYDFYDERNILVYDGKIDLNSDFFKYDYREIPEMIYEKYSLLSWMKCLV